MKADERRAVREQLRNVSRSALIAALGAVFDVDARAQATADDASRRGDNAAAAYDCGFADGTDTAAAEAFAMVMGRPPADPAPTGAAVSA
jgi:hypothetical protein